MDIAALIEDVKRKSEADTTKNGEEHVQLLESIRQLTLAAETPAETLMRMRFEPLQSAAIRIALEAGVLHAIEKKDGRAITASELAKTTGYDKLLIVRVMRLVTFVSVCKEVDDGIYAATETTRLICTPGLSGGEKHHFDLFFPIGAKLMEYMRETKIHQFPRNPREQSPFEFAHGTPMFEYIGKNQDQRDYLDDYMAIRRQGLVNWYETFPMAAELGPEAKKERDAVLLVDIGGGWGHDLQSFHKAYPDIPGRLILQDLPIIVDRVEREGCPVGVECMAYDFFQPQQVQGARAYYFHNICHDWPDEETVQILTNTTKSMEKAYSRILIDDYVLPDTNAPIRGSSMDLLMMMFLSGIERTERQWKILLDRCGLEIVKIWKTRSDYESVIEARLKECAGTIQA